MMNFTKVSSKKVAELSAKKVDVAMRYICANRATTYAVAFKASNAYVVLSREQLVTLVNSSYASAIFEVDNNGVRFKRDRYAPVAIARALGYSVANVEQLYVEYEYSDNKTFERFACELLGYRWIGGLNYNTAIEHDLGLSFEEAVAQKILTKSGKIVPDGVKKLSDGTKVYLECKGCAGHLSRMKDLLD